MKFCFKCNEANHQCDKHQYDELHFFEVLVMKIHLFLCRRCREYSKRNKRLTDTLSSANLHLLPEEEKTKLKNKLQAEMRKDAHP